MIATINLKWLQVSEKWFIKDNSIFSYVLHNYEVITHPLFTFRVNSSMLIIVTDSLWNCCLLGGGRKMYCPCFNNINRPKYRWCMKKAAQGEKKETLKSEFLCFQPLLKQSVNHLPAHMHRYTNLHVAPTLPHTPKTKWRRVGDDPSNQGWSQTLSITLTIVFLCKLTGGEQRVSVISAFTIQLSVGESKNCVNMRDLNTKTNLEISFWHARGLIFTWSKPRQHNALTASH